MPRSAKLAIVFLTAETVALGVLHVWRWLGELSKVRHAPPRSESTIPAHLRVR